MAVTLRDVAARAGVSTRTVSNVVNGFQHISPAMRTRVQAAMDELNYTPNLLARSLRQGRTGIITLLVPEITVPYFGELAHEVVEQARQLGCTVMIDETGGEPGRERELLDVAFDEVGISDWSDKVTQDPRFMRPAEVELLIGDSTKAHEKLGWTPKVTFDELVRMMVRSDVNALAATTGR